MGRTDPYLKLTTGGVLKKTTAAVSPRGPKRGNPSMTTSTVTARRKGDPQHKVEGKISLCSKNRLGKSGSLFKVNDGRGAQ